MNQTKLNKNILLISFLIFSISFHNCEKKKNDNAKLISLLAISMGASSGSGQSGENLNSNVNVNLLTTNSLAIAKNSTSANFLESRNTSSSLAGKLYAFGFDNVAIQRMSFFPLGFEKAERRY